MILSIGKLSKKLSVTTRTIWNWIYAKKIRYHQEGAGKRTYFYWKEVVEDLKLSEADEKKRITICYCRVSTNGQNEDLNKQKELCSLYCASKGYNFIIIEDIGSGINYNNKGLNKLIGYILEGSVDRIVLSYKDRLVRFGFELLEKICREKNVIIEIINQSETLTYEQELVNDILSIITVFSARLYGKRSHKNKKIIEETKSLFSQ